jgi:hypothetical protein
MQMPAVTRVVVAVELVRRTRGVVSVVLRQALRWVLVPAQYTVTKVEIKRQLVLATQRQLVLAVVREQLVLMKLLLPRTVAPAEQVSK